MVILIELQDNQRFMVVDANEGTLSSEVTRTWQAIKEHETPLVVRNVTGQLTSYVPEYKSYGPEYTRLFNPVHVQSIYVAEVTEWET